jgi:hypothetical protein
MQIQPAAPAVPILTDGSRPNIQIRAPGVDDRKRELCYSLWGRLPNLLRWRYALTAQTRFFSLRQQGTFLSLFFVFRALRAQKTKNNRKIKYRCE